jgi:hypothetical protein
MTAPSSISPLLELKSITKRFPGVLALSNVSFTVSQAEVVARRGEARQPEALTRRLKKNRCVRLRVLRRPTHPGVVVKPGRQQRHVKGRRPTGREWFDRPDPECLGVACRHCLPERFLAAHRLPLPSGKARTEGKLASYVLGVVIKPTVPDPLPCGPGWARVWDQGRLLGKETALRARSKTSCGFKHALGVRRRRPLQAAGARWPEIGPKARGSPAGMPLPGPASRQTR